MTRARRILVINGHPDPSPDRLDAALAAAYADGARAGRHEVRRLAVGELDFPLIGNADEFIKGSLPACIAEAQSQIAWAEHILLVFPLWLGGAPARLKGFLEQTFRYGFALPDLTEAKGFPQGLLKGRSVRLVVTMGMPAWLYRLMFAAVGVRAIESGILGLSGLGPIRRTLIGGVDARGPHLLKAVAKMRALGASAA